MSVRTKRRKKKMPHGKIASGVVEAASAVVADAPKLSVCMMVKNEEKMLPACLESIRDVADELIVLDTGSADHTVEIAESFGAIVHHQPWQKDFSLHRNQSISYATGDWILQIDADERLDEQSRQRLKKFLATVPPKTNSVMVVIRDCTKDGELRALWNFPRLFRNRVGAKYVGKVHNQVLVPGAMTYSDVTINHFGYDLSPQVMRRKYRRTVTLLRSLHRENPQDPFATYFLANSYCAYKRYQHAIVWGEKSLVLLRAMDKAPLHYLSVYSTLITSAMQLRRYAEAKRYCNEVLQLYPRYLDAHYYLTCLAFMSKQFAAAAKHGADYFATRDHMLADPANCSTIMHYTLNLAPWIEYYYGLSALALGRPETGEEYLSRCIRTQNVKAGLIVEMVHNLLAVSRQQVARKIVEDALRAHAGRTEVLLLLARELLEDGLLFWIEEPTNGWTDEQILDGASPLLTGCAYLLCGRNERALQALSKVPADEPQYACALLLANQVETDLSRQSARWQELIELQRQHRGSPALAYSVAARLLQQQRAAEILELSLEAHAQTENTVLFELQLMQAATMSSAIDKVLEILARLLQAANLPLPGQLDSLSELSQQLVALASFYKCNLWHDAATEAIRLACWFDQGNVPLQARHYANLIDDAKSFGRVLPISRAVIREVIPMPGFKDPILVE